MTSNPHVDGREESRRSGRSRLALTRASISEESGTIRSSSLSSTSSAAAPSRGGTLQTQPQIAPPGKKPSKWPTQLLRSRLLKVGGKEEDKVLVCLNGLTS